MDVEISTASIMLERRIYRSPRGVQYENVDKIHGQSISEGESMNMESPSYTKGSSMKCRNRSNILYDSVFVDSKDDIVENGPTMNNIDRQLDVYSLEKRVPDCNGTHEGVSENSLVYENCESTGPTSDSSSSEDEAFAIYAYASDVNVNENQVGSFLRRESISSSDSIDVEIGFQDDIFLSKDALSGDCDAFDKEDYKLYEYYWESDEFSDEESTYANQPVETKDKLVLKQKRKLEEIVVTEVAYVNRLRIIYKASLLLEGANMNKKIFPSKQLQVMFPCIETLLTLHSEHLLPALKTKLQNCSDEKEVTMSVLWQKYIPFMSMYKQYTSQIASAISAIQEHKNSSQEFSTLLEQLEKRKEFRRLCLDDYLMEPVQRLCRYKLLLQDYKKYLLSSDDELKGITDVINKLDILIKDCEQATDKSMFEDFKKVQEKLEDSLSVLNPKARYLKEGAVTEVTTRNHTNLKQRYLFLFTDFLLVCRRRGFKFSISSQLDISELRVRPAEHLVEQGYSSELTILLKGREKVIALLFSDNNTKEGWEEILLHAIALKVGKRMSSLNWKNDLSESVKCDPFERAPQWVADDSATSCSVCAVRFIKVFRRRHHCRGCGIVVCNKCSGNKMALPYQGNKVSRVCDPCFMRGRQQKPELTRRISTSDKNKPNSTSRESTVSEIPIYNES